MKQQPPMSRAELEAFHSILRRAAELAERQKRTEDAAKLAEELANIDMQLAVTR